MKFCSTHYVALRTAIEDRGLWPLVGNSETLAARVHEEIETVGNASPKTWDPLASACWGIYGKVLEAGGMYLMTTPPGGDPDGDADTDHYCPLCEVEKYQAEHQSGDAQAWIDGCCDAQLAYAREHGLVPQVQ
mgnify:CR=1 FL=1